MIAGVIWAVGVVFTLAWFAFANSRADQPDGRYTAPEVVWASLLWPLVIMVLATFVVLAKVKAVRS